MKKIIAALILTAATVAPALASDGDIVTRETQPTAVTTSNGTDAYASTRRMNWQFTQDVITRRQDQTPENFDR